MEIKKENKIIEGHNGCKIAMDLHYAENAIQKPIAIFIHGYKGFKDFGAWELIGDFMAKNNIVFIRFNFSHNGTSLKNPNEFTRLDLFAENNFSIEQKEIELVLNEVHSQAGIKEDWDENKITLIGHSRGGGMAILASYNPKVSSLITWAAIKDVFDMQPAGTALEQWKKDGVRFVVNGRTKQNMPHNYQFYEDTLKHKEKLDIRRSAESLKKPWLIIHGDNDEAVPLIFAQMLHQWNPDSELEIIENGTHTFSTKHPWDSDQLPNEMRIVVQKSIEFIKSRNKYPHL